MQSLDIQPVLTFAMISSAQFKINHSQCYIYYSQNAHSQLSFNTFSACSQSNLIAIQSVSVSTHSQLTHLNLKTEVIF